MGRDGSGAILIPGWLAKWIGGVLTAFVVGTASWAWTIQQAHWAIQTDVAVIKTEVREIQKQLDRIVDARVASKQ